MGQTTTHSQLGWECPGRFEPPLPIDMIDYGTIKQSMKIFEQLENS